MHVIYNKTFYLYTGSPGSTTVFQNVSSGLHSLRVTARSGAEEADILWRVFIPTTSTICSANLVNVGLVVNGTTVSLEFRGVGLSSGFNCRLDNGRFSSCELYSDCNAHI